MATEEAEMSWKRLLATNLAHPSQSSCFLDSDIFIRSIANQFEREKQFFTLGTSIASLVWLSTIGFRAGYLAHITVR